MKEGNTVTYNFLDQKCIKNKRIISNLIGNCFVAWLGLLIPLLGRGDKTFLFNPNLGLANVLSYFCFSCLFNETFQRYVFSSWFSDLFKTVSLKAFPGVFLDLILYLISMKMPG